MSTHPTPAERLLAILEEDEPIETLAGEEVRAELSALGVDPARSIAFARGLAAGGDSPGGQLMGALLAGEDEEDEIARIEAADIEEVRANVSRGVSAAIAAEARRKAGLDDNVIGLSERRRKRRRLIVRGGPLAGIAASFLVLAVFMGNAYMGRQSMQIQKEIAGKPQLAPAPEMPDPTLEGYVKPGPSGSLNDEILALELSPEAEAPATRKQKSFADEKPPAEEEMLTLAEPMPAEKFEDGNNGAAGWVELRQRNETAAAPAAPTSSTATKPLADADTEADVGADGDRLARAFSEQKSEEEVVAIAPPAGDLAKADRGEAVDQAPAKPAPNVGLLRNVEISNIAAALAVDPAQAPLLIQSPDTPGNGLADRVDEARQLAGDRPIIALYTIATGDIRRDYAQVPLQPGQTQQLAAPSPLVGLLGVRAGEYDFIPLPDRQNR